MRRWLPVIFIPGSFIVFRIMPLLRRFPSKLVWLWKELHLQALRLILRKAWYRLLHWKWEDQRIYVCYCNRVNRLF